MEPLQTVVCTFPSSNRTLRYAFAGACAINQFVVRFRTGVARAYDTCELEELYKRLRADPLYEPPIGIVEVDTGYGVHAYDSLYCAMRLLGHTPVRPHRSRTYWSAIADPAPHNSHRVFHRFAFNRGRLPNGLAQLLGTVYGIAPSIELV